VGGECAHSPGGLTIDPLRRKISISIQYSMLRIVQLALEVQVIGYR
jgi:hypothetical protein